MNSPFRVAVINDEISQDFGRACEVASKEFRMEWIELRGVWNKNLLKLEAKEDAILVLENEPACNTATAAEAVKVLGAVRSSNLMLNWDPGNAAERDEKPYPDGYDLLPKDRIGHCHCKDAVRKPDGKGYQWAAMGRGIIDWLGQFRALKRDGYHFGVSLETHWRGADTPEESSRQSWAGMKKALQDAGAL